MASITMIFGFLLIALGVGTYVASEKASATALIPAGFGLLLLICGFLARNDNLRKHAMHAASTVGLVGFIAAVVVLILRSGTASSLAIGEQVLMALLCASFVIQCVRSFIVARRARAAEQSAG